MHIRTHVPKYTYIYTKLCTRITSFDRGRPRRRHPNPEWLSTKITNQVTVLEQIHTFSNVIRSWNYLNIESNSPIEKEEKGLLVRAESQ